MELWYIIIIVRVVSSYILLYSVLTLKNRIYMHMGTSSVRAPERILFPTYPLYSCSGPEGQARAANDRTSHHRWEGGFRVVRGRG